VNDELDFTLLPEELQTVAPLISRYGESDDVKREALLESTSDESLKELAEAASSRWDAINAFLDENVDAEPGPRQDVALALDSFAQAAMEAPFTLEARSSSSGA
jgi:cell division protein FtsI/penicillin-binding protein 2